MATRVIFISANVQRFFRYENSARSTLVYNGVDVTRFTPSSTADQTAVRDRLGLPIQKPVALFVGRFVRKKGLHVITELSARFPDVLWILVGSGPEQPEKPPPNLKVIGRVEHDRLPLFYQAADFLILPSSGEGFPLVVQEALCCGAGVLSTLEVASACPQTSNLIRTCPASRDDSSVDDWDRSLRALLADKEYLADREARSTAAHSLWSWAGCVTDYLEILNKMMVTK
jgi:glycosyltransferase involved in cell wall biosynthesis